MQAFEFRGLTRSTPVILQTESSECGLACLAMIATHHGHYVDLPTLRSIHSISMQGITLSNLIKIGVEINLAGRAVKLDLNQIDGLRLPCILHWNFNHFVVLTSVKKSSFLICDPAVGKREISLRELSDSFTGVALEMWPTKDFTPKKATPFLSLSDLMGNISGMQKALIQAATVAVALELTTAMIPLFLQWVIDEVIVGQDRDLLWMLMFGFGIIVTLQQVLSAMRSWLLLYLSTSFSVQWRTNIFNHLIRLPIQYFQKRPLGDIMSRFGSIEQIQHVLTTAFLEAILDGFMTIITLMFMLMYDFYLGLAATIATIIYIIIRWLWYKPQHYATAEQITRTASSQTHFLETLRGIKTIKIFHRHEERRLSWTSLLLRQVNADIKTEKLKISFKTANGLIFGMSDVIILSLGAGLVLNNKFTVGTLMAFIAFKSQFDNRATSFIDKVWDFKMLRVHTERLADIAFTAPEKDSDGRTNVLAAQDAMSVEVSGLSFRYSEHDQYILNDISFRIEAGESVAFVGPSGCGKTTLFNILIGILSPTEGKIIINGIDILKFGNEALRKFTGVVLQDDVLFAGSLADNITFFDSQQDSELLNQCAKIAAIDDDINAMPMGYNTLVGDMGTILSGGQKQRILLARALYKKPRLLYLDEATSSLDMLKERQVNEALRLLKITKIIIAHRPETIAFADRVIKIEGGRASEIASM